MGVLTFMIIIIIAEDDCYVKINALKTYSNCHSINEKVKNRIKWLGYTAILGKHMDGVE